MWLAQFVCAPQFFKTPKGLCGHTVVQFVEAFMSLVLGVLKTFVCAIVVWEFEMVYAVQNIHTYIHTHTYMHIYIIIHTHTCIHT
jgi:hypothetical protein